jgi:hypothetical protein
MVKMTNEDHLVKKAKRLRKVGVEVTRNTIAKNRKYGDAARSVCELVHILYPEGIPPHQYGNALLLIRLLDKVVRVASYTPERMAADDESPWIDIAGYGLLGAELFLALEELGLDPGEYEL